MKKFLQARSSSERDINLYKRFVGASSASFIRWQQQEKSKGVPIDLGLLIFIYYRRLKVFFLNLMKTN